MAGAAGFVAEVPAASEAAAWGAAAGAGAAGVAIMEPLTEAAVHIARKELRMKVAITAAGEDLSSAIDQRFGRARYLVVVDLPERAFEVVDNQAGLDATQGAGIQAAQKVIDSKATVLITGHCGPKAFRALTAGGIDVYLAPGGTVADALTQFEAGDLSQTPAADVDSHW